ncbi:hypothetical protein FGO68_gene3102 [Halteria grandinella]|uniref:Uncharacterized protein n=1 Tax=Halteria grandinella TaxID=5974 RepID=A0A8J8NFH5_HALGN|nr:hypothetical protein FGO68_gene3102 [Halteria grandinella]
MQSLFLKGSKRSFSYAPQIQFIGKRTKADKAVGVNPPKVKPVAAAHHAPAHSGQAAAAVIKALSPNCAVHVDQEGSVTKQQRRLPLSKEEIEAINNGGYDEKFIGDWRKIKI